MPENPNKDYWINRAEATIISGEKSIREYELELKKAYESASAQIEKEIRAFYSKYAKDNKISLSEARRRLKPSEKKSFNAQAKVYLDEIAKMGSTPMTKEYMAHLKRLSGKAYMSRLDELNNNIRYNIEKLYAGQSASLGRTLNEGYEDSYYRTMFNAQDQAKLGISFTTPGKRTVEAAVKEKWLGQNYSDRIWTNKNKLVKQLEQILPQEFVRSKGPASVARTLSQKLDVSYNNAKRLARTEMNYISNKATMQAYIDNGIDEYEYVATLDARTSDICRELDGKTFPIKEASPGINWPPLHPNCRSTTIPYFEDDDIGKVADDRIARAKDGKGKSIKLGQDVSFFEWVEEYGSPEFKDRVKAQRYKFLNVGMPPMSLLDGASLMSYSIGLTNILYNPSYDKVASLSGAGVNPEGQPLTDLEDAFLEFTAGGSGLSEISTALLKNENDLLQYYDQKSIDAAATMIDLIDKAPIYDKELYRVEELGDNPDLILKKGTKFTLGVRSFTRSKDWVEGVISGDDDMDYESPVLYKVKGAKGINLKPYSPQFADQEETATAGEFEVKKISSKMIGGKKTTVVELEQVRVKPPKATTPSGMTREQMKAYNKLVVEEPAISKKMKDMAKDTNQTLKGYKFRLKTEQSYSRKVKSDMLENNISEKQAIKDMNDVIRYTLVSSPKNLVKNFNKTKKLFKDDSYKLLRVKNSWTNKNMAYKGVNCVFQSPNGEKFEVQFHTPESFSMKQNELHKMYEEQRLPTTSTARRVELEKMMLELSKTLEVPKDIEKIGK